MNIKKIIVIFIIGVHQILIADIASMNVSIKATSVQKMKLIIGVIDETEMLASSSENLKEMLERSRAMLSGFSITRKSFDKQPSKKEMAVLAQEGFGLGLFISQTWFGGTLEWRLYDLDSHCMIKGKRFAIKEYTPRIIAEHVADQVWPILTGQGGFFSTRIAYCKEKRSKGKKLEKHIYVTAPYVDCERCAEQSQLMVEHSNAFAPRWNSDAHQPMILYSEITPSNVRLMSVALDKKRKIVANLDGFVARPSFSPDGKKVVYCSCDGTPGSKSNIYLYQLDENGCPVLERITHNNGQNISPMLCDSGDIVFCSDAGSKQPYICYYHAAMKEFERITPDGYCSSPSYCAATKKIAYSKMCNGVAQLFSYDLITKQHTQLTFDVGNKEESCWSPCGNYLAFTVNSGASSRIAVHHLVSNERIYVTNPQDRCCYPSWSPLYSSPIIL
jgi:TolB protein